MKKEPIIVILLLILGLGLAYLNYPSPKEQQIRLKEAGPTSILPGSTAITSPTE